MRYFLFSITVVVLMVAACKPSGGDKRSHSAQQAANATSASSEAAILNVSVNGGLNLAAPLTISDYKLSVNCENPNSQKVYSKVDVEKKLVTISKSSKNCLAFLSEVTAVVSTVSHVFTPKVAITKKSFENWRIGAYEVYQPKTPPAGSTLLAKVQLEKKLPQMIPHATNEVDIRFDIQLESTNALNQVDVTITHTPTQVASSLIEGESFPNYSVDKANFVSSTVHSEHDICKFLLRVNCAKDPKSDAAKKLISCDALDIAKTEAVFSENSVVKKRLLLNSNEVIRTETYAQIPVTLSCKPERDFVTTTKTKLKLMLINKDGCERSAGSSHPDDQCSSVNFNFDLKVTVQ